MDITMLTRARQLWCVEHSPYYQQRHNMRAWVRAIRVVGDNWLLHKKTGRANENASNSIV